MSLLDLDAIAAEWATPCGLCDYGMPEYGCTCSTGDPRPIVARLLEEIRTLRAENQRLARLAACCTEGEPGHDGPCGWFCSTCSGAGTCPDCNGTGPELAGCDTCDTTGTCPDCAGRGKHVDVAATVKTTGGVL